MKKIATVLIFILLFTGCVSKASSSSSYSSASSDGSYMNIFFSEGTSSEGVINTDKGDYAFSYKRDGSIGIVYPNGYIYSYRNMDGAIMTNWTYDETPEEMGYIDGLSLVESVERFSKSRAPAKKVPLSGSLLIIAVGGWQIYSPKSIWWLSRGWLYKNAEPSDAALIMYGLGGVTIVFVGIMSLFS